MGPVDVPVQLRSVGNEVLNRLGTVLNNNNTVG